MTESGRTQQPDIRHYLRLVWRRKWILLAVVVLIPTAVYLYSQSRPKVYEASTIIQLSGTTTSLSPSISVPGSGMEEAARLIKTRAVGKVAAKELGESPDAAGGLVGQVSADTGEETSGAGFLTITASADDPQRAADVANAFAAAITTTRTDRALGAIDGQIRTLEAQRARGDASSRVAVDQQIQELRALRASQSDTSQVIDAAIPPNGAVAPNPGRNARLALVLALLVAAGLVPLIEVFDRRLRNPEELEGLVEAPLLGTIPRDAFPGGVPGGHVREAFQTLRAALTYFNVDNTLSKVMVASPGRGEGKTTVAANLAIAMAQDERDVILIDGDLRRPQVANRFGLADDVNFGLDAVLVERRSLSDALLDVDIEGYGRLRILPGGTPPPNPSVLLGSDRMRTMLNHLADRVDVVIIDTPPLLAVSDAIPLLEQVAGTVLIARMNQTSRDGLARARQVVTSARGSLLGVIATGTDAGGLYSRDGYGYGYGYGVDVEAPIAQEAGSNGWARRRLRLRREVRNRGWG